MPVLSKLSTPRLIRSPLVTPVGASAIALTGGNDAACLLLLHCDGADASTTFTDSSASARTVTANGNAQIDTAQSVFGGASALFDGTGDYLTVPDSTDFNFGTNPFTIDFRARNNGGTGGVIAFTFGRDGSAGSIQFRTLNTGTTWNFRTNSAAAGEQTSSSATVVDGTWYHVAIVKNGSTFTFFLDGVSQATLTDAGDYSAQSDGWVIGSRRNSAGAVDAGWPGWIDEFRVSNVARWTTNFTPPTAAYS